MSHPTHHLQVYKHSVPVKEALDLTNHPVTPTAIYVYLSRQRHRDNEAVAVEDSEGAVCTLWKGSNSPPLA